MCIGVSYNVSREINLCMYSLSDFCDILKVCFSVGDLHRVSKNCARLFLSELLQISTNFDNLWQKDGKEAKIMRGALTFHLT